MPLSTARSDSTDARPILERTTTSIWSRAELKRDDFYDALLTACATEGFQALVLKSAPFVYPPWVSVEIWTPKAGRTLTERASATITILPQPYHRFEFEYQIRWTRRGKTKSTAVLRTPEARQLHDLLRFLVGRGKNPLRRRLSLWGFKNKVRAVRPDYLGSITTLLLAVGILLAILPIPVGEADAGLTSWLGVLLALGSAAMKWRLSKRVPLVRSEGKPHAEPRNLVRVDSWQTVIFGLGAEWEMVHGRFLRSLQKPPVNQFRWHIERVWYWGLDGKEEREQIVLESGRGIVFCQIYPYGEDLYVGWDGHLNTGQWVEQTLRRGVDRESGSLVTLHTVVPGRQRTSEYDVIDLSCLMEWTHAQIVKLLKQLIKEREIDQEIDFTVLRGERQRLTADETERTPKAGRRIRDFMRLDVPTPLRRTA